MITCTSPVYLRERQKPLLRFISLRELQGSPLLTGAQERTRTFTILRTPAPEAGASTNSATWAGSGASLDAGIGSCQLRRVAAFRLHTWLHPVLCPHVCASGLSIGARGVRASERSGWSTEDLATVLGGTGFVGRYAVRALAGDGWRIRAATRRPDLAGHLQPMGAVKGKFSLCRPTFAIPTRPACGRWRRCCGEPRRHPGQSGAQTFHAVHVAGARAVAREGRRRERWSQDLVHVSAIGADRKSPGGKYGRTKAAGEARRAGGISEGDHSAAFARVRARGSAFQSLRRDDTRVPVSAADRRREDPSCSRSTPATSERAIATALKGRARSPRTIYELGGPDVVTFRQAAGFDPGLVGRAKRWLCAHPLLACAGWAAFLTVPLPNIPCAPSPSTRSAC